MTTDLMEYYRRLYSAFGPQHWWPGDGPFEVAVGAILTQNTNWENVEKAIRALKSKRALSPKRMHDMPLNELAGLIRPSGYYNIKARRLKEFVSFLIDSYGGSLRKMAKGDVQRLRAELLAVNGIGPETADSILLYALGKPVFVIDAYTKRILSRHGVLTHDEPYGVYQGLMQSSLKEDAGLFNEYHALLVMAGKTFCRPSRPACGSCPLNGL